MEMAWFDSSSDSEMDLDILEEDMQNVRFTKARRGPQFNKIISFWRLAEQTGTNFFIQCILDERDFHPKRVQIILRNAWDLRDNFYVMGKDRKFYVLYFENEQDRVHTS